MSVNWFKGAARPQLAREEEDKPQRKRTQADHLRPRPVPLQPPVYWGVEKEIEVHTAYGTVPAYPGEVLEISEQGVAVLPPQGWPAGWKFTRRD